MVDSPSGDQYHISPDLKQVYKQDFLEGTNLFEQSFQQYQQSQIPAQQEAFKDVMKKAMTVMNETAKLCLNKEAQKSEEKVNQNFEKFEENPNPQTMEDLNNSIKDLKKDL